jgi:hypothetical protein
MNTSKRPLPVLACLALLTSGCGGGVETTTLAEHENGPLHTFDAGIIDGVTSPSQSEGGGDSELDALSVCISYMVAMQTCYDASSVSPKEPDISASGAYGFCVAYGGPSMIPYYECMIGILETLNCSLIVDWRSQIAGATAECFPLSEPQPQEGNDAGNNSTTFGSACQAAADAMAACGATYAATLDTATEETTGDEVAAAECVDDASTDDWYNCMADAYDAGDCGTMDGMVAAGTAAAACAASM